MRINSKNEKVLIINKFYKIKKFKSLKLRIKKGV